MTNANSFHSAVFVLLLFAVIYFVALGIFELKKWITNMISKRKDKNCDFEEENKNDSFEEDK